MRGWRSPPAGGAHHRHCADAAARPRRLLDADAEQLLGGARQQRHVLLPGGQSRHGCGRLVHLRHLSLQRQRDHEYGHASDHGCGGGARPRRAGPITVTAPTQQPDLDVYWTPTLSSYSVVRGNSVTFFYQVDNLGTGAAGSSTSGIYLSNDSAITSTDTLLTTDAGVALAPGGRGPSPSLRRRSSPTSTFIGRRR